MSASVARPTLGARLRNKPRFLTLHPKGANHRDSSPSATTVPAPRRAVTPTGAGHPRSWTDSAAPTTEIDQGLRKRRRAPPARCPFGRPTRRPILLAPSPLLCTLSAAPPPRLTVTPTVGARLALHPQHQHPPPRPRARRPSAHALLCTLSAAPTAPAPGTPTAGARLALHPRRRHPPPRPAGTPNAGARGGAVATGSLRPSLRGNAARAGQLQRSRSWTARQRATSFSYASVAASASPRERAARPDRHQAGRVVLLQIGVGDQVDQAPRSRAPPPTGGGTPPATAPLSSTASVMGASPIDLRSTDRAPRRAPPGLGDLRAVAQRAPVVLDHQVALAQVDEDEPAQRYAPRGDLFVYARHPVLEHPRAAAPVVDDRPAPGRPAPAARRRRR